MAMLKLALTIAVLSAVGYGAVKNEGALFKCVQYYSAGSRFEK